MVKSEARPEKESFLLIRFYYGTELNSVSKYTNWDRDFLGHTSEPRLTVSVPDNTGTFDRREGRIILPNDVFSVRASNGSPHSPIFVIIEEVTQSLFPGDQNSQKILYAGRVQRTIANYQGRNGRVAFLTLLQKVRLDVSMGVSCNHHCGWNLFHGGCGASPVTHTLTTEIDSVDGQVVTIVDAPVLAKGASDSRYWKKGYMLKDGLRITIRDYDGSVDTGKFQMARKVPTDWVGGSNDITIVAGCDKTVETCRSRFGAEEFFLGLGFAIPPYQPNFESKE